MVGVGIGVEAEGVYVSEYAVLCLPGCMMVLVWLVNVFV